MGKEERERRGDGEGGERVKQREKIMRKWRREREERREVVVTTPRLPLSQSTDL